MKPGYLLLTLLFLTLIQFNSVAQSFEITIDSKTKITLKAGKPFKNQKLNDKPYEIDLKGKTISFNIANESSDNGFIVNLEGVNGGDKINRIDSSKIPALSHLRALFEVKDGKFKMDNKNYSFDDTIKITISHKTDNGVNFQWKFKTGLSTNNSSIPSSNKIKNYSPTGFPLIDAIVLRRYLNTVAETGDTSIQEILSYYSTDELKKKNFENLESALWFYDSIEHNFFLRDAIKAIIDTNGTTPGKAGTIHAFTNVEKFISSGISSAGNLDVTNLADGFAKFLVKRTKEELNAAFFMRFKDFINKDEYRDARILFPATYSMLNVIGDQIYNYNSYLNALREAFEKDLNSLLTHFPEVINDGHYKLFFDANPEIKAICLSSLYIGNGLVSKEHPGIIIENYPQDIKDLIKNQPVAGGIDFMQLLSKSLRSQGNSDYWADADTLKMLKDKETFKIYLGLLYQQGKDIRFTDDIFLDTVINFVHDNVTTQLALIENYVNGLIAQINIVKTDIKAITGNDKSKLTFQDYYNYYNAALDLIEYASTIHKLPLLSSLEPNDRFKKYMNIGRAGGDLALDINKRNYSSAVMNAFKIYQFALDSSDTGNKKKQKENEQEINKLKEQNNTLKKEDTLLLTANKQKISNLEEETKKLNDLKSTIERVKQFIMTYGSFMAAIVQAENSDEVEAAIESMALPSGSSRIKRESAANVSLNAYCGFFAGYEQINGVPGLSKKVEINTAGVTAPIGIAVSVGKRRFLGMPCKKEGHWSYSAFISLVDLGAVAAFRFKDTITESVPTIQLKNIISPGLFFSIGIPKTPLSFNIGAQMGPNLRQINVDPNNPDVQNDYSDEIYWRYSASLCVDIPLLNFANRINKKRK